MTRERFERLVAQALQSIPRRFRTKLQNIAIVVDVRPSQDLLDDLEIGPDETLLGLYQGTPLTERRWDYGNVLPDRISLFQEPIEDECDTDEEVIATIGETLIHEVGHYFGLSEEELEAIEERYWRRQVGAAGATAEADETDADEEPDR